MSYCTVDNVKGEFKELAITATSVVKDADVQEYIAEADAEINAIVGLKYVVPISSGDALTLCRRMSRAIVAERIAGRLEIATGDSKTDQSSSGKMSRADALKLAQDIADGKVRFDGAQLLTVADGVSHGFGSERVFRRGVKQW